MSEASPEDSAQAQLAAIRSAVAAMRSRGPETATDTDLAQWSSAVTDVLLPAVQPLEGMSVLDVASGQGEPALRLAGLVGALGRVVACDSSADDLAQAARRAHDRSLPQLDFCVATAERLPFPEGSFDLVTCQLGIALFTDRPAALREMHRVLRPGGRAVLVSWGASGDSAVYAATIGVIGAHVGCQPPDPGAPDPYRYGEAGVLADELRNAGFSGVVEQAGSVELLWRAGVDRLWELVRSTNLVIDPVLGSLRSERRSAITDEVLAALTANRRGDALVLPATVHVVAAVR